jgi:hypothetical protein
MGERGISGSKSSKNELHAASDLELARMDAYEKIHNWK